MSDEPALKCQIRQQVINFHYNHSLDYIVPKCKAYFLTSYIQPGKAIFNANHNIFPYIQYPVWKNPPFICIYLHFFQKTN